MSSDADNPIAAAPGGESTQAAAPKAVRALLDELRGGEAVRWVVATGSTVDTGGWLRGGRLWAGVTDTALLLAAAGRRSHGERLALADLRQSLYNHTTGELVLVRGPGRSRQPVRLEPMEASRLLEWIHRGRG